jgi:hypothetical protein
MQVAVAEAVMRQAAQAVQVLAVQVDHHNKVAVMQLLLLVLVVVAEAAAVLAIQVLLQCVVVMVQVVSLSSNKLMQVLAPHFIYHKLFYIK